MDPASAVSVILAIVVVIAFVLILMGGGGMMMAGLAGMMDSGIGLGVLLLLGVIGLSAYLFVLKRLGASSVARR